MSAEPAGADDDGPSWASGLLPPDGAAWPPEPVAAPLEPVAVESLPTVPRRPDDAAIADWRTMSVHSPDGYSGSPSAPPLPSPRVEPWSVVAFVCALAGVAGWFVLPTWGVAMVVLPLLALGFGVAGRKACTLDPTRQGKWLATAGLVIGVATLAWIASKASTGALAWFS